MNDLVSMNYLIVLRNGDTVLLTDTFKGGPTPIAYTYILRDGSHCPTLHLTLTDHMNILQDARNVEGRRIYVFEEWS